MSKINLNKFSQIEINNAKLIYRNFGARPTTYNPRPGMTFNIRLGEGETIILKNNTGYKQYEEIVISAEELHNVTVDGVPLKIKVAKDNEFEHLPIKVNYDSQNPPKVMVRPAVCSTPICKAVPMTEASVSSIDDMNIVDTDVVINIALTTNPTTRELGCSYYLDTLYVTMQPDRLGAKYGLYDDGDSHNEDEVI